MSCRRKASRRKIKTTPYLGMLGLVILLVITFLATIYLVFLRPGTIQKQVTLKQPVKHSQLAPLPPPIVKEKDTIEKSIKPRIAIIIDDIGYQRKIAEKFINLDLNLNFSILPHSPKGPILAQKAKERDRDILLHLPMEPTSTQWKPGPGAMFLRMSPSERKQILLDDLKDVHLAVGVNNHMGSRYTENRPAMISFLQEIKKRDLFFVDSLTTSHSVGYALAKEMSIKTGKRDVFIDNDKNTAKIIKQLRLLVKIAEKYGHAIGIGHPHPATLKAIMESHQLLTETVSLVAIHEIVN